MAYVLRMERGMIWTTSNLVIQIITGILGAHFAATAAREHSFGSIGHTLAGAIGGGLSGYFLQKLAVTVVTANGSLNEISAADNVVMQGLAGIAAGGCLTLVVGFIKHAIEQHRSKNNWLARASAPLEAFSPPAPPAGRGRRKAPGEGDSRQTR